LESSASSALNLESLTSSQENEGVVVSAKRFKPNTGKKLKQHSSEVEPREYVGLEEQKMGQIRVLTGSREEPHAYADRNAREQADTQESKDAPKKQTSTWYILCGLETMYARLIPCRQECSSSI
jgi:hypothetical protein